jgi:hypothetical protein
VVGFYPYFKKANFGKVKRRREEKRFRMVLGDGRNGLMRGGGTSIS